MDTNRIKKAAEWFYSNVFRDEAIRPKPAAPTEKLPPLLRTARSLENSPDKPWQTREAVFLKQARLLASYEDDYPFTTEVVRYFPTYQSLTDLELREYFSWRTKLRRGEVRKTSLSFAFLYIYELLNQVGVAGPMEGYRKLTAFRDAYVPLDKGIRGYLDRWLTDYVTYYGLDPSLLDGTRQVLFDRSITVLDLIREQEDAKVLFALQQVAPKWLSRSKFYKENQADFDTVIVRILRRMSDHYAKHTKKTMVEQFFGLQATYQVTLFDAAVFCNPLKKRNCEFILDERCVYRCKNGFWTVTRHSTPRPCGRLENILKTVDAVMRDIYGYKHPVKCETEVKWLMKIIREEICGLLEEKKAAEAKKITIDYSQLAKIRREAAITQDKLTVEEEEEETPEPVQAAIPESADEPPAETPLDAAEYRLLQSLLYGGSTAWVQAEGFLLSVLVDSINEKLYDTFQDSVLDDTPELIEDYIEDLKEMVKP